MKGKCFLVQVITAHGKWRLVPLVFNLNIRRGGSDQLQVPAALLPFLEKEHLLPTE